MTNSRPEKMLKIGANQGELERLRSRALELGILDRYKDELDIADLPEKAQIAFLKAAIRDDERIAKLTAERTELTAENAMLNEKCSVQKLLGRMPEMLINSEAPPSVIGNESARNEVECYRKALTEWLSLPDNEKKGIMEPKRPKFHLPAMVRRKELDPSLLKFDINFEEKEPCSGNMWTLIKSSLYTSVKDRIESGQALRHHNETSPQDYLFSAVTDVLNCCFATHVIEVAKEATMFSLRPDILVITYRGQIMFQIEVNNP